MIRGEYSIIQDIPILLDPPANDAPNQSDPTGFIQCDSLFKSKLK